MDLDPLTNRLVAELRGELATNGSVYQQTYQMQVCVDSWRQAARTAAGHLERPVRTGVDPSGAVVWAALSDWPLDELERRRTWSAAHPRKNRLRS